VVEEPGLGVEAAGESGEVTVRAHHPMARNDDRDRVLAVGRADGSGLVLVAQTHGLFAVGDRLAEGDLLELVPGVALEVGTGRVERQIELGSGPLIPSPVVYLRAYVIPNPVPTPFAPCSCRPGDILQPV
jgi:hypothetical protein